MQRIIKSMEAKYLQPSLELVEDVFTRWDSAEEGKTVRRLVEEIRSGKYYLPGLYQITELRIKRTPATKNQQEQDLLKLPECV